MLTRPNVTGSDGNGACVPADAKSMTTPHLHVQADPGHTMQFCNGHDPLPLLGQLRERYGDRVVIQSVKRERREIVLDLSLTPRS